MNYIEAALTVLKDAKRPLTAKEIVDEAMAKGLPTPQGKTPQATLSARLYVYVRDHPESAIERHAEPGRTPPRARRNSVKWGLHHQGSNRRRPRPRTNPATVDPGRR
jgi:hypothetical protein